MTHLEDLGPQIHSLVKHSIIRQQMVLAILTMTVVGVLHLILLLLDTVILQAAMPIGILLQDAVVAILDIVLSVHLIQQIHFQQLAEKIQLMVHIMVLQFHVASLEDTIVS